MGVILDEFRDAIKNQKVAEEKKEPTKISSSEEDYIREFESRLERVQLILERLESEGVETRRLRERIEEKVKNITWSLKR